VSSAHLTGKKTAGIMKKSGLRPRVSGIIVIIAQPITHIMTKTRYAIHPEDFKSYDTGKVRSEFLLDELFVKGKITHYYTHYDRLIVGGVEPEGADLKLETIDALKSEFFLERREIGIINVGANASVTVDGSTITLNYKEALYIGRDSRDVIFHPAHEGQALFYYNSAPAHHAYPTRKVTHAEAETAVMGSHETANHRTIRKLLVNSVLPTCHLQMGLTELQPGSVWNTMPPHTHDRRMEAYFYFEVKQGQSICHFLGQPEETRHIWMQNNQAVLSPPWSIHSGVGTSNYSFIWGMAGENLDYSDMDAVHPTSLR
jgi:4-deoxy-L-threo-5-hexosulose-uronate ketol-isomerase